MCTAFWVLVLGLMVLADEVLTHDDASSTSAWAENYSVAFATSQAQRTICCYW